MAVIGSEIKFYQTTGGLGGAKLVAEVADLFGDVTGAEAAAGSVNYACCYVENTNGVDTLTAADISNDETPSLDTDVAIALDVAGLNAVAATIADSDDSTNQVSGLTFGDGPLVIGDMAAGDYIAVWVRRTVNAGAGSMAGDGVTLTVSGDTV